MNTKTIRAFTLIELIVVISIIVILTAIVLPAIVRSRKNAYYTTDISNLKQIGVAAELYMSDNNDIHPLSVALLESAGYIKNREVLVSNIDPFSNGYAAAYLEEAREMEYPLAYPVTYGDYSDTYGYLREDYQTLLQSTQGAGWLLNFMPSTDEDCRFDKWGRECGSFQRLQFDGSVQRRRTKRHQVTKPNGEPVYAQGIFFQLADGDEAWMEKVFNRFFLR